MKRLFLYLILSATTVATAFAQKDADAKLILNKLSKQYRTYDAVKTDYSLTIDNQQANVKETFTGTLIAKSKTNKYKVISYAAGTKTVSQDIISDGKNQWTYLKDANEVQLSAADNSEEGFNPAKIFTMYEKGYKYIYTGQQKIAGKVYQVIDLTPEDSKKTFFKVRLMIDKVKNQLYSAQIFDKNGSKYTYTLRTFTPNYKVAETAFVFDKKTYPGVEVVDLR
ncbi:MULTISPECIES: outer membrane lipoprotein carrier protein LolA [unclassified Mucilaginibacter]|uniref:LolA family protein n=1 Tax=unclassified Mucilaginibacter TaxID=2617802 RepID=UPI002AC9CAFE|nr:MULTISPECIES: outer membrane lipoprotein carrier protein LolA [unclassified Mucilaginibacter]MEB0262178.1 outer membrane lipoprotein carrier protein LolA [Mucilaginibacter sp. 10I4]MEB0277038.1 outer membrane lipoprotein carrier protein LolA [Mucilaginibacter sp. 10B2]MEB0302649.1 outer membrane lipoprotein carrier protein LolA [Mucilaginibacter sp. 5C4]WPX25139.1 outer membrane lipoprotein carrier protein LolA [Mucilaginibacter sp. 5C4]